VHVADNYSISKERSRTQPLDDPADMQRHASTSVVFSSVVDISKT